MIAGLIRWSAGNIVLVLIGAAFATLAGLYGLKRPGGVLVSMKIAQADLADWLGVSRQSINLAMQQLREEHLVQSSYSAITITDPVGLAARIDA